jgi:hypothetical protein
MNWRIRTSFKLLGIPHRKKRKVTKTNGTNWPAGKSECVEEVVAAFVVGISGWSGI